MMIYAVAEKFCGKGETKEEALAALTKAGYRGHVEGVVRLTTPHETAIDVRWDRRLGALVWDFPENAPAKRPVIEDL